MAAYDINEAYRLFTTTVALITTNGRQAPNVMAAESRLPAARCCEAIRPEIG